MREEERDGPRLPAVLYSCTYNKKRCFPKKKGGGEEEKDGGMEGRRKGERKRWRERGKGGREGWREGGMEGGTEYVQCIPIFLFPWKQHTINNNWTKSNWKLWEDTLAELDRCFSAVKQS